MSEVAQVPQLRFPEFKEPYRENKLSNILKRYSAKNSDEEFGIDDILSLSSKYGIVDRKSLLEDTYDKVNHLAYIKTRLNDFVYGKSISSSYPYGLFKVNNCRDGLLSTLYFTFQVFEDFSPQYLDKYFSHFNRANNFLKKYVLVGDRYITADSNYILSGTIYTPTKPEQQKIAAFLSAVDNKIELLGKKQEQLKEYKKSLMQKIFSREIRFKSDDGSEFPEWEEKSLKTIFKERKLSATKADGYEHISLTTEGVVPKSERYERDFLVSDDNSKKYKVTKLDDICYNPANLKFGVISRNKYSDGIFSPIYVTFEVINADIKFIEYFVTRWDFINRVRKYEEGTVYERQAVKPEDFLKFSIPIPSIEEQTKIASLLSSIDTKIEQTKSQLDSTKEFKKALLQQMFV